MRSHGVVAYLPSAERLLGDYLRLQAARVAMYRQRCRDLHRWDNRRMKGLHVRAWKLHHQSLNR
jgi:hypothetical protein